jgi:hypothetical protein
MAEKGKQMRLWVGLALGAFGLMAGTAHAGSEAAIDTAARATTIRQAVFRPIMC